MKKLKEILFKVNIDSVYGDTDIDITKITFDSRNVEDNTLFIAIKGHNINGHDYIEESIKNGASVIICEKLPENFKKNKLVYICVNCTKSALSIISSNFYDNPSSKIDLIGVTGTNGKTTIASLLFKLFNQLELKSGLVSTINIEYDDFIEPSKNTTPDPITLNHHLSEMINKEIKICFIEVSSHGIFQKRVNGLDFKGMIFTNLTHDHLDYHKSFKDYRDTKKTVFDSLDNKSFALINMDDKNAKYMVQNTSAKVYSYSLKSKANFSSRIIEQQLNGMLLSIETSEIWTKLIGKFNASNLLAILRALFSSVSFNRWTPNSLFPILPPALILGPNENPRAWVLGALFKLLISERALIPAFSLFFIIDSPCFTNALFNLTKGTTSQTVPNATRSKNWNKSGSFLFLKKPFFLSSLLRPIRKINVTPAAHKSSYPLWVSTLLGLMIA